MMKRANLGLLGVWATSVILSCGGITQPLGDTGGGGVGGGAGAKASPSAGAPTAGAANAGAPSSNTGGSSTVFHPCESECVHDVFKKDVADCKLCHGTALKSAGLDLESPGISWRLKDVPATHGDLSPPGSTGNCPVGDLLIDTNNPENSWLLKKVRGQQGDCGTAMPQTPPMLTVAEQECLSTYVYCVAGQ